MYIVCTKDSVIIVFGLHYSAHALFCSEIPHLGRIFDSAHAPANIESQVHRQLVFYRLHVGFTRTVL